MTQEEKDAIIKTAVSVRLGEIEFAAVPEARRVAVAQVMRQLTTAKLQGIAETRQYKRYQTGGGGSHHSRVG